MALFSGTVFTDDGKKLAGATVNLSSPNTPNKTTTTDNNGNWSINVESSINNKDTTISISKNGYDFKSIPNPQPTGEYILPPPQISVLTGGTLNLSGGFDAGKYLVTSLNNEDKNTLDQELYNIKLFIENNPGNYTITILSSESKLTNFDREETSSTNNDSVPPRWLSTQRQNNLEKYILDYLSLNGTLRPDIIKPNPLIQGPENGRFPPDSPEYKKYQYIKLEARLIRPRCSWVEVTGSLRGDKTISKPSDYVTRITLDAAVAPDRFGINGVYNNYYSQSPTAPGSLESWQFMAYIGSTFGRGRNIEPFIIDRTILKNSLLTDYNLVPTIKDNINKYALEKRITNYASTEKLIENVIDYAGNYGKRIVREETNFPIANIPLDGEFTINAENSLYVGGSAWKYKMCD
jgi:hypothetical protein